VRLVLDAGALIALERHDRRIGGLIELGRRAGAELVTTAPVVGQVWRDGPRQANLARALAMIDVRVVGMDDGKRAGELLAVAGGCDVTDALVALQALPGDQILTGDLDDLTTLVDAAQIAVRVVQV
jgi:hypothetical protein